MKSKPSRDWCESVQSDPQPNDTSPNIFPTHVALAPRSRQAGAGVVAGAFLRSVVWMLSPLSRLAVSGRNGSRGD